MLSEEKLQESVNTHIAKLLAKQVMEQLREDLQNQWDMVIFELASTRKSLEQVKKQLVTQEQHNTRFEEAMQQLEAKGKGDEETRQLKQETLKKLGVYLDTWR